jgi:phage antirepressor YoqD-like protein
MRSKLPAAEQFEEWVVGEVLPSIRKTGGYQLQVPQTLPEALRAYADEVEAHQQTRALAAEMKPKAEFVDRYVDAVGTCTLTTAAKNLGVKRKDLIAVLERDGKLFRRGGRLEPYAEQVKAGRFVIKAGERNGHAYSQLYLTPKGLQHVAETYMPELEV